MKWKTIEDNWTEDFSWFLIDEGRIQYSFRNHQQAQQYQKEAYLDYMLLTNLDNITHQTMLDPQETYCWTDKIQRCLTPAASIKGD